MRESVILHNAVDNLKKWVHLPIDVVASNNRTIDAILRVGNIGEFQVEVKKEVHKSNLYNVLNRLTIMRLPVLVAESISKSVKKILIQESINYIDIAGNCFLSNGDGLYVQIEGKKWATTEVRKKHVAFNKNGIKLIYAFLLDEDLVNQTYDVMAKTANIAKSTIGNILKDLVDRKFLIQLSNKERRLDNKRELLERCLRSR